MINKSKFILYNNNDEFNYNKSKSNIDIRLNRVAFIFLFFSLFQLFTQFI